MSDEELESTTPSEWEDLALFQGMDVQRLSQDLLAAERMTFKPGDIVLNRGVENYSIYLILEGRLSIHLDEDSEAIAFLEKGDTAGEMSVIAGYLTSAFVKADTHAQLLVMHEELVWRLFDEEPRFARNLLQVFAQRLVHLNAKISAAQALQEQYRYRATTDALTGLYNRHWLSESLDFEMSRCAIRERPLSLLMLDIDYFKRFNDSHGHVAGDAALKAVAEAVQDGSRGSDLAVRYGGEEIVVILPGADMQRAKMVAERLHSQIRHSIILHPDGHPLPSLTVSIGVAQMLDGETHMGLIERTDAALYRAKHAGRDRTSE